MKHLLAATALSTLALVANPAFAQEAAQDSAESSGIGDIVVTAQKRAENIQEVPIAISAVGSQFLETRGITSIDALGSIAPNVKFERAPSNKTISQIAIRGSVTINPAVTWEPAAGLYLNGVYIAKAQGSIFDVADLDAWKSCAARRAPFMAATRWQGPSTSCPSCRPANSASRVK